LRLAAAVIMLAAPPATSIGLAIHRQVVCSILADALRS
jgi:hypothetical protein